MRPDITFSVSNDFVRKRNPPQFLLMLFVSPSRRHNPVFFQHGLSYILAALSMPRASDHNRRALRFSSVSEESPHDQACAAQPHLPGRTGASLMIKSGDLFLPGRGVAVRKFQKPPKTRVHDVEHDRRTQAGEAACRGFSEALATRKNTHLPKECSCSSHRRRRFRSTAASGRSCMSYTSAEAIAILQSSN